jgi:hypothetical protein
LESTPRDDDTDDFGNENVGNCCLSLSGLHVQAVSNHFLQPVKGKQKFVNTYFFFFFLNLYIQNEFSDPIIYDRRKLQ